MHKMLELESDQLVRYNWVDCHATGQALGPLRAEMRERGMEDYWDRAVWPMIPAVMSMQRRGIAVDAHALSAYRGQLASQLDELEANVVGADPTGAIALPTKKGPNGLGSPKRLAQFLYGTLGLKPGKRTETGDPSTNQEALLGVLHNLRKMDEHARPVLYDLLHRSRLHTIYTRYLEMPVCEDGRVRPRIKLGGTRTGRFAYADPPLQQIPPEARFCFKPSSGCVFVGADYSQLEARIAAYLAGDSLDIGLFESGLDVHADTARTLFGWTEAHWSTLPKATRTAARNFAKTFRYGLLYGGSPETMKMKTYCPCPRCEDKLPPSVALPRITEASARWLSRHPALTRWRDEISHTVATTSCLTNPLGRRRYFLEPWPRPKRMAWNWPIQSTAADIINRAMVRLHREHAAPLWLQMHDYLGVEVPSAEAPRWAEVLTEVMEAPVPELGGVRFPVDLKIESPWGVELEHA
jgi:DNA polymerase-1